jgi:hypothetical protein
MKTLIVLLAALVATLIPSMGFAQDAVETPSHTYDRWREFLDDTVRSRLWWIEIPAAGAIDQATNEPEDWSGRDGYAKRNASDALKVFSVEVIDHAVAMPMHQHVTYDRCTCKGMSRLGHAFSRVFVAVDSRDGHLAPNVPLWVSLIATPAMANAWEPHSYTAHDVAVSAAIAFGATAGIKVLKEFIR